MEASWSPDSVKLAYVRIDGKYTCCEVHVVDRLGFNDSYVAGNQLGQGLDPVWSPDGRLAYMSLGQGGTGLHIVSIGGIDLAVATAFGNPVWSPNGRLLCSRTGVHEQRTQTIEIASADGKGVRAILTGTTALAQTSDPVWSPDSRSIAFIGADDVGTHLYLSDADGTDARQLTSGPVSDTWPNWPGLDKVGL